MVSRATVNGKLYLLICRCYCSQQTPCLHYQLQLVNPACLHTFCSVSLFGVCVCARLALTYWLIPVECVNGFRLHFKSQKQKGGRCYKTIFHSHREWEQWVLHLRNEKGENTWDNCHSLGLWLSIKQHNDLHGQCLYGLVCLSVKTCVWR